MTLLERWANRIYSEDDVAKSIATSTSGVVGLIVYLLTDDPALLFISLIIAFPPARIAADIFHKNQKLKASKKEHEKKVNELFDKLTPEELKTISAFVDWGGCVMTWNEVNKHPDTNSSAIESLIQRGLIFTSVTADSMRETFVLDEEIFNLAVRAPHLEPAISDEAPF